MNASLDLRIVLMVIGFIGLDATVLIIGIVYSMIMQKDIDAIVAGLAGTALGYLGGVLTSVRTVPSGEQPVIKTEITNEKDNPVPTKEDK